MSVNCHSHLDSARTLAGCLSAELQSVQAMLTARERLAAESEPRNRVVLELTIWETYGLGLILGLFAEQAARLEADLEAALRTVEQLTC